MAALAPCPACQMGNHAGHDEHWQKAPEGVLGGAYCNCRGDCRPPASLQEIFDQDTAVQLERDRAAQPQADRIAVVLAMTKAATDLGWHRCVAESSDDEVTVTMRSQPLQGGTR